MTTTASRTTTPTTVRSFLLDDGEGLDGPLRAHGTAGPLLAPVRGRTPAADRAVEHELATVVDDFLGMDVLDLATAGWRGHSALRSAARRTRDLPGSEEVVALATHRVTSAHRPYVDVYVDGVKIGTLDVQLNVVFWISGLVCVVRDACLTGVRSGECAVDASLGVQGAVIAERRGGRLDLPGGFAPRGPVPLLRDEPNPHEARTVPGAGRA
ncbi:MULTISPECIES: hypothetical protein [Streptomyces]|uniref:Uncharacterized protein n=1 Tax=Streptomyces venezuelae (strain ATCC 10712 / CBS 650.69 / DSM 40230 / JCM 4526 / NBRC 13096 / PD 04745) TaxID=953739 RepID=F2R1U9_STRVP|nr:hypothetical protein [Streptomyces venezuelae]APE25915.1 hypothetical protein vnz_36130 [Streptomyces venezuelae]QES03252.1 hypothetical protein DEJ43_36705 [Streptomyces venezuelae ATCC 10712]QES10289.1 hypothetical protein DEJ44_34785 [Streptomyces venezuelae]CCA60616.1 hypothetical protein SVEN_7330 [Streptomyces venezuelae ATCC 10712]